MNRHSSTMKQAACHTQCGCFIFPPVTHAVVLNSAANSHIETPQWMADGRPRRRRARSQYRQRLQWYTSNNYMSTYEMQRSHTDMWCACLSSCVYINILRSGLSIETCCCLNVQRKCTMRLRALVRTVFAILVEEISIHFCSAH